MKNKILLFSSYMLLILMVVVTSSTLAKYTTTNSSEIDFPIGSKLYFNYQRSELYRNNQVISFTTSEYTDEKGDTKRRIETMNVAPQDVLAYYYYVSNFNDETLEYNSINGQFTTVANARLAMPSKGTIFDVDCTITYRKVPVDGSLASSTFSSLKGNLNLLNCDGDSKKKEKYEFKVTVIIDDQIENTTYDDYIGSTLTIYLYVNATSK